MKVRMIAHGVVQGVGYRYLVWKAAKRHGITGSVRNVSNGSVEIFAEGDEKSLKSFEEEIQANEKYGPQVMKIEKCYDADFSEGFEKPGKFVIRKDKEQ